MPGNVVRKRFLYFACVRNFLQVSIHFLIAEYRQHQVFFLAVRTNRTGGSADTLVQTYSRNLSTEALNGTWRLRVNDNANLEPGYINSWSVTF